MSIYNHESVDSSCSNSLIWRRGKMVHFTSGFQEEVNSWSAKSDWWTARSLFVGELVWPVTLAVWVEDFAGKETRRTHTHTHTHTCTHTNTHVHTHVHANTHMCQPIKSGLGVTVETLYPHQVLSHDYSAFEVTARILTVRDFIFL